MNRLVRMVLWNLAIVPGAFWKLWRYAAHPEKYSEEEMWNHTRFMLNRAIRGGNVDLTVTGLENIPQENGFMLYANHQGLFDVVAIGATCVNPIGAVLKKELYDIPFLHQIALCTKSFAMDREDVRQSLTVIQSVTEEVKKGRNYLIFPEGTRSKQGNTMQEFHGGSFRCATKSKCPVVPVALVDSFAALDRKGSEPLSVQLHYLPPIAYEEYKDLKPAELALLVRGRIEEKIRQATAQEA